MFRSPCRYMQVVGAAVLASAVAGFYLLFSSPAAALPIGFGVNQGSLQYSETKNDNFYVYYDSRTPAEGTIALEALESARPHLERWFGVHRVNALPVISSAATSNASFANFITDALEVQSGGTANRDLYLHEFVHSTMYRHFDYWFGPPGAVIHLAWMPAWFIEGLAEALSVSVGSDVQAGIERYQALAGDWPTYDRLHSLYGKYNFALRGYATSGSLVSWILKQGNPNKLPFMIRDFYDYSKPWWWVWAAVPWNGFMPMDRALQNYAKFDGRALYEKYKEAATAFWKKEHPEPLLASRPGVRRNFSSLFNFHSIGGDLRFVGRVDERLEEQRIQFGKSGWAERGTRVRVLPSDVKTSIGFSNKNLQAYSDPEMDVQGFEASYLKVRQTEGNTAKTFRIRTDGMPLDIWDTEDAVTWWEQEFNKTSICFVMKGELKQPKKKPVCPFTLEQPKFLEMLGVKYETGKGRDGFVKEVWFNAVEQTLVGDRSQILIFDAADRKLRSLDTRFVGRPVAAAFPGTGVWILSAEKSYHTLRKIEGDGRCIGMNRPADHVVGLWGHPNGDLSLGLYQGNDNSVLRLPADSIKLEPCRTATFHSSPLLVAFRKKGEVQLPTALADSSTWTNANKSRGPSSKGRLADFEPFGIEDQEQQPLLAAAGTPLPGGPLPPPANPVAPVTAPPPPFLGSPQERPEDAEARKSIEEARPLGDTIAETDVTTGPAKSRVRPVLVAIPWIGAEDVYGSQVGIISIPLMDHLQNNTVRATFLLGLASAFPNTDVSWVNTRFWPTLSLGVFRMQTYNGIGTNSRGKQELLYYEEKGVRGDSIWKFQNTNSQLSLGVKSSKLDPYLGSTNVRRGKLNELNSSFLTIKKLTTKWTADASLLGVLVPEAVNDEFDYNQLGFSAGISRSLSLFASQASASVMGKRTRGKKTRVLKEMYSPLQTFVPGSGGGYNKNNFGLAGPGALFRSKYGDSQGKFAMNWVIPIIPDFDKLLWIFYIERLDFTAFFNYGGVWNQRSYPLGSEIFGAHGYNFDLQFDLKGVRFNLGLGTGQVLGDDFEVYVTSGFDAIF